jgi:murein hydrolase activator
MKIEARIKIFFCSGCSLISYTASYFFLFLFCPFALAAEINTEQIEKDHQLQNIRSKIKNVESGIEEAKEEIDSLLVNLRKNEQARVDLLVKIKKSEKKIDTKDKHLKELADSKDKQEALLNTQRDHLSEQIRAAYKTGRSNYLKLLLNQEKPEQVGRMLAYYEYDTRARADQIASINLVLSEISSLEEKIQVETQQLTLLQINQKAKLDEFKSFRNSRRTTRNKLQAYIDEQDIQLQLLQKDEQELTKLVGKLKHQELAIQVYEDMPPFNSLQGKLNWPVRGKIASRFGSTRKGGKLKRQGVTIVAKSGDEVKAITAGKVVFADWFRNMGLLLILDHGDGFMSLYGHNERLLKKSGDWVLADELIARVGDTGGQQKSGLYFEIRQSGNPVNPTLWCKK